ncbi:LamG-like jellyroll fold domain-containing protein [Nanoarchaeota archaeon]
MKMVDNILNTKLCSALQKLQLKKTIFLILILILATSSVYADSPNQPPTHDDPILDSELDTNTTDENIIVTNQTTNDPEGDPVKNIINWYKDTNSITLLNMPFEANNGTEVINTKDYSSHNNNGIVNGAVWNESSGHDGFGSYTFDGVDDFIEVNAGNEFNNLDEITISSWVSFRSKNGTTWQELNQQVVSIGGYFILTYEQYGNILFRINNESEHFDLRLRSNISNIGYVHIAATYKDGWMNLYVNGQNMKSRYTGWQGVIGRDNMKPLLIGANAGSKSYLNGSISDLKIYNRALSSAQISSLYNNKEDVLVSQETMENDVWKSCIIPTDSIEEGLEKCSSEITILSSSSPANNVPTHDEPILSSSSGQNKTDDELTVSAQNTNDNDSDPVKNIIDWYVNGSSIAVLNMPFEGGSGVSTRDYSSYNNSINLAVGAVWNESYGYDGKGAYAFDGVDDSIIIPGNSELSGFDELTLSAWVSFGDKTGSTWQELNQQIISNTGSYLLWYNSGAQVIGFRILNESKLFDTRYKVNLIDDGFHHIAATYSNGMMNIYVDGLRVKSQRIDWSGPVGDNQVRDVYLGSYYGVNGFLNGTIDEVMIYSRALSQDQINLLYQSNLDKLSSAETDTNDQWVACVTPNDGKDDGQEKCSNTITILESIPIPNTPPQHSAPLLESALGKNQTTESLQVYNQSTYDDEGDPVKNIINWYINDTPILLLNMPFEGGSTDSITSDYSDYNHEGIVLGANWVSDAGHDGFGAYVFDGLDDSIIVPGSSELTNVDELTLSAWVDFGGKTGSVWNEASHRIFSNKVSYLFAYNPLNNALLFRVWNASKDYFDLRAVVDLNNNGFHHVAATYVNGEMKIYVDGVLAISQIADWTGMLGDGVINDLYIGSFATLSCFSNGTIDDPMIFNRALSADEINYLYNKNPPDVILEQETSVGDRWKACLIPNDGKEDGAELCSNEILILVDNTTIVSDDPPAQITDLNVISKTNSSINWSWTKPNDTDFSEHIIYLDGVNIINTTEEFYHAVGLLPNTTYTINVHTKDIDNNVNDSDVINETKTYTTSITGTVYDTDTGNPIMNVNISVYPSSVYDPVSDSGDYANLLPKEVPDAVTDVNGNYIVFVDDGSYHLIYQHSDEKDFNINPIKVSETGHDAFIDEDGTYMGTFNSEGHIIYSGKHENNNKYSCGDIVYFTAFGKNSGASTVNITFVVENHTQGNQGNIIYSGNDSDPSETLVIPNDHTKYFKNFEFSVPCEYPEGKYDIHIYNQQWGKIHKIGNFFIVNDTATPVLIVPKNVTITENETILINISATDNTVNGTIREIEINYSGYDREFLTIIIDKDTSFDSDNDSITDNDQDYVFPGTTETITITYDVPGTYEIKYWIIDGVNNQNTTTTQVEFPEFTVAQTKSFIGLNGPFSNSMDIGDVDGDNDYDFVVGGYDWGTTGSAIYENDGTGYFTLKQSLNNADPNTTNAVKFGDVDNDGDLDLFNANGNGNPHFIYKNDGGGFSVYQNFGAGKTLYEPALRDLDNDGDLDIIAGGANYHKGVVYKNNGSGYFEFHEELPLNVIFVNAFDADNDGDLDVVVSNYETIKSRNLLKNDGTGHFTVFYNFTDSGDTSEGVASGDFNNDGFIDVAIIYDTIGAVKIFENDGTGIFTLSSTLSIDNGISRDIETSDLNSDGYLDIVTGSESGNDYVYLNDGLGNFNFLQVLPNTFSTSAVSIHDFDGDYDQDILVSQYKQSVRQEFKMFENHFTIQNTMPIPPISFNSTYSDGKLTLSWNDGFDNETLTTLLTYNLRIGTSPDSQDIFSGKLSGEEAFGNVRQLKNFSLNIPDQEYYWSIQTIDAQLKPSNWSTEQHHIPQETSNSSLSLEITSPIADTFYLNDSVWINATTNDTAASCSYDLIGTALNGTLDTVDNLEWYKSINVSGLDDDYNLTVDCDGVIDYVYPFKVDTLNPQVSLVNPTFGTEIKGIYVLNASTTSDDVVYMEFWFLNGNETDVYYEFIGQNNTPGNYFSYTWNSPKINNTFYGTTFFAVGFDDAGRETEVAEGTIEIDNEGPGQVTNLVVKTGRSQGSIDLFWTAPGDNDQVGKATAYEIRYAQTPILTQTDWDNAQWSLCSNLNPDWGGSNETCTITGLGASEVLWYAAINATDNWGNTSPISNSPGAETGFYDVGVDSFHYEWEGNDSHTIYKYDTVLVWGNVTNYGNVNETDLDVRIRENGDTKHIKYINLSIGETKTVYMNYTPTVTIYPLVGMYSSSAYDDSPGDMNASNTGSDTNIWIRSIVDSIIFTWYDPVDYPNANEPVSTSFYVIPQINNPTTAFLYRMPITISINGTYNIISTWNNNGEDCGTNSECFYNALATSTNLQSWENQIDTPGKYNITVTAGAHPGDQLTVQRTVTIS